MKRTQIQLPDRLFKLLKARAADEETTLAHILRKAGEYYLTVHPAARAGVRSWSLPEPGDLGQFLIPEERWREMAYGGED
jgi:hypothetical protein